MLSCVQNYLVIMALPFHNSDFTSLNYVYDPLMLTELIFTSIIKLVNGRIIVLAICKVKMPKL